MKLTVRQREALIKLSKEAYGGSAYNLRVSLSTLEALSAKGFVSPVGYGHMAFPRNATWKITQAGRAAMDGLRKSPQE